MSSPVSEVPGALDGLPVLEKTKLLAARLARADSAPTAVLVYGSPGAGMDQLASFMAKSWLCKSQSGQPCDDCAACRSFDNGRCVDFQKINPYGAGRLIKKGAMREGDSDEFDGVPFLSYIRTRPLSSPVKVTWFAEADRFQHQAVHIILKALEELPSYCRVVLTTTEIGFVIPTVRSRCVLIPCALGASGSTDPLVAKFATSPGDEALLGQHRDLFDALDNLLSSAVTGPPENTLRYAERFRELVDSFTAATKLPARSSACQLIQSAARWFTVVVPEQTAWVRGASTAHRRILGNVSTAYAVDCWFLAGTHQVVEHESR